MGRRMMGLLAAAAAGVTASVVCGQPEYLRLDPGGNINNSLWLDTDGEVLAWTESPGEPAGLTTHIWRRTAEGWEPEAAFHSANPWDEAALTALNGQRVVMRALMAGVRVWRHDGERWLEEPVERRNDIREYGEAVAIHGDWLAIPVNRWGKWNRPLALVYHFDGAMWRAHSYLDAPTGPDHYPVWLAIEGDLLAVSGQQGSLGFEPAPVILFRLDGEQWQHEATLPVDTWWVAINKGRVATLGAEGLLIYAESSPGSWEIESLVRGVSGHFELDGDTLVTVEKQVAAQWGFEGRAVVYRRRDTGWQRTRVLYPSNAYTMEFGASEPPNALSVYNRLGYASGEVFAVTAEGDAWSWEGWRIVGFPACAADFNGDGVADFADLPAFLEGREQGMLSADYNMNGLIGFPPYWDEEDFLEFVRLLEEGC